MGIIHFLNVKEGDCTWVKHSSGRITVIDICNGNYKSETNDEILDEAVKGNFKQNVHPVNPIEYLKEFNINRIFRFILTHPDMDHMDGFDELNRKFDIQNIWSIKNTKDFNGSSGTYNREDFDTYKSLERGKKVLYLYHGCKGKYYNMCEDEDGDGIYILSPTKELVEKANKKVDSNYNDCSYVLLYKTKNNKKIIFAGDSGEDTWEHIIKNYKQKVKDVDILIAPHHGRKSGGNDSYLDILKPKLTLFGNAKSQYLDYASWNSRNLEKLTNNQAGCIILNTEGKKGIEVYVTNKNFAEKYCEKDGEKTEYCKDYKAWYLKTV